MNSIQKAVMTAASVMALMMILPGPGAAPAAPTQSAPQVVSPLSIEISGARGETERYAEMARALIPMKEGDPFSTDKIQASVEALRRSGVFQAIEVPDTAWDARKVPLTFRLIPFRRVKDIQIHRAFPLLQKEVLNAMTIFTGDAFAPGSLNAQDTLITLLFQDEGYPEARVELSATEDPEDGHVVVTVAIDKGPFKRIRTVEILGNHAFSDTRLKLRTDTWKASLFFGEIPRFVEKKRAEDEKRLIRFYRSKGYADVTVTSTITPIPGSRDIILRFRINEGPRYIIQFKDNKEFWDLTLKKELNLNSRGNRGDLELKRGIRAIRERYRNAGYLETRVRQAETITDDETPARRTIVLTIKEGPHAVVDAIVITGNTVFTEAALKEQMLTQLPGPFGGGAFVPKTLAEDISAMETLYLKRGYLEITITEEVAFHEGKEGEPTRASVSLDVNEGTQTRIRSIRFNGLSALTEAEALAAIALKTAAPFREYMVQSDENTLSEQISEQGYPHVSVDGQVTRTNGGDGKQWANLTFDVDEGPQVETGEIFYMGNFRTREKVFRKEAELISGTPFSLIRMLETQRNIRNINALDSATFQVVGLQKQAERVNMLVEVEEKKPYYVEAGLGYDTRRKMYANTRLGDRNLWGLNYDGWVAAEWSQIGYRGELGLTTPRFLGTRTSSTLNLFGEDLHEFNQDFGTRTYGASLALNRPLTQTLNASLTSRYERRDLYQVGSDPIAPEDEEQYDPRSLIVTTPSLIYNSTDSFIRPRTGVAATGALEVSKGIESSLDDFFKHRYELRTYHTPFKRLTFAFRGRYRHVAPYGGNDTIADDQSLFLGGTSDIRGFGENKLLVGADGDPVGGRTSILGSIEARFDLGLNFELTTFYDTGTILKPSEPNLTEAFRSSAGTGLRYITPIGPIGFLYGWKLDRKTGESPGNLHFSIGYTF